MRGFGWLKRQDPIDGTETSMWPQVSAWWSEFQGTGALGSFMSPRMADRVWVANRCIQLNSQQIASMPLRFQSNFPTSTEPAWVSNPDPVFFPNGIGDAVFAAVRSIYGWGFAILHITTRYASGFPQGWTVLDPSTVTIRFENGRRAYRVGNMPIDALDIVQIDRNPSYGLQGTSALSAYAAQAWGLVASGELAQSLMQGGVPTSVLKTTRKLTEAQAELLREQWAAASIVRGAKPAVLPPEVDFETLSISPKDLALLDLQQFTASVIASAYGVPAFMLNIPLEGALIYQNPQMLGEFWWRFELRPTAKRVADALSANMLPRGSWVDFDSSDTWALLAGTASQADDEQAAGTPSATAAASPSQQTPVRQFRPLEEVRA